MTPIKAGDEVRVLDLVGVADPVHAVITGTEGAYIRVRYDTGRTDQFYADSGWRAWDGELRWRLESFVPVARTFTDTEAWPMKQGTAELITADEAVAALTAGAFHEQPGEDDYRNAVECVLSFCADHETGPAPLGGHGLTMVSPADVREVVEAALGKQRVIVHCMLDSPIAFLGADWDLEDAIKLARKGDSAWTPGPAGHELAVRADGRIHRFDVRKPDAETTP